jgi:hypothetical protein
MHAALARPERMLDASYTTWIARRWLTPRVRVAPEYDRPAIAILLRKDIVQHDREAVQVTDVQRAKVGVEGIVKQAVVDGEVYGRWLLLRCCLGTLLRSGRPLAGRS